MSDISIPFEIKIQLKKKSYGIVGKQGAVQICTWTKKALKREFLCYKAKFYGVDTHRCAEVTPITAICSQNCIFCWRPMEFMKFKEPKYDEVDDPEMLIKGLIEERKRLLSGFKGNKQVDKRLLEEALYPTHWAISLSGEPTLYPRLLEMIDLLKNKYNAETVFVVTNAQHPERFMEMKEKNIYPDQLYVSIDAPNKELFDKINRSVYPDGWERLNKSLEIIKDLPVRKVARITLIKGMNDDASYLPLYAEILKKGDFDFIEVKAYMWIGYSRRRLKIENMPSHEEVKSFALKLLEEMKEYKYEDEVKMSRIVLLTKRNPRVNRYLRRVSDSIKDIKTDVDE